MESHSATSLRIDISFFDSFLYYFCCCWFLFLRNMQNELGNNGSVFNVVLITPVIYKRAPFLINIIIMKCVALALGAWIRRANTQIETTIFIIFIQNQKFGCPFSTHTNWYGAAKRTQTHTHTHVLQLKRRFVWKHENQTSTVKTSNDHKYFFIWRIILFYVGACSMR